MSRAANNDPVSSSGAQRPGAGLLVVLAGPSGVGKSTIARALVERTGMHYAVSATTRPFRPGDEAGKRYEHISRQEFLARLDRDEFLEYAEVYGEYYGTPKHPTVDLLAGGQSVLLEIDVQGALQVRSHYPAALLIFILPPDEPTLLRRLEHRGRDAPQEIARRFRAARREIHMARGSRAFDHMVVNDDLQRAIAQVVALVTHAQTGGMAKDDRSTQERGNRQ